MILFILIILFPEDRHIKDYRRFNMSKEMLKGLIELVPDEDVETLYKVVIKFIPETEPEPDELAAIQEGRKDRTENGTIPHEAINWD